MKNCVLCGKPVVLVPSAQERARRFGGKPSDYAALFDRHAGCEIDRRAEETSELIRRKAGTEG